VNRHAYLLAQRKKTWIFTSKQSSPAVKCNAFHIPMLQELLNGLGEIPLQWIYTNKEYIFTFNILQQIGSSLIVFPRRTGKLDRDYPYQIIFVNCKLI
jgi:hypothetical protein